MQTSQSARKESNNVHELNFHPYMNMDLGVNVEISKLYKPSILNEEGHRLLSVEVLAAMAQEE